MPLAHELRGRVGMWCLIAAESAIFTIFVVAYLYYAGKSLSGPTPREVLHVPIFNSICLFSSSFTIVMAERAIAAGQDQAVRIWWLSDRSRSEQSSSLGTAREWYQLIYVDGLTISTNLFGTTFYSLVGLHAFHVIVGLTGLSIILIFAAAGIREAGARAAHRSLRHVLALCGCDLGGGSLGGVLHRAIAGPSDAMNTTGTTDRRRAGNRDDRRDARADGVAVRPRAGRRADFCGAADQRVGQRPGRDALRSAVRSDGFARCFRTSTTKSPGRRREPCRSFLRARSDAMRGRAKRSSAPGCRSRFTRSRPE